MREPLPPAFEHLSLAERIFATLALIERRGFCVELGCLAEWLVGGAVAAGELRAAVERTEGLHISGDLVHTDRLDPTAVRRTLERQQAHPEAARRWWSTVEAYVEQLVSHCPQIRCVALAGSMAAGGFVETDDVDFNLFVEDDTRYTTYLQANVIALGFSARHRRRPTDAHTRRPFLPKLMSINVIWAEAEVRPFVRQDGAMALELFLSRPLWGDNYYRSVLGCNRWLDGYFPQFGAADFLCPAARSHRTSPWCRWRERFSYAAAYAGWRWVMWTRRHNPEALARVELVRKYQHPYALFGSSDAGSGVDCVK
ncbi:hypothetical protein [Gloeobacter morelensis]|uniref:Polymerase nucleotidyl transferase domain-containing protein n=1 Tax=Gloeobacter morelensis MG652769 TaxID=2781736 RepID=A0ABY3PQI9_9CYAN|nr:hypothetical protein [Gloeobacter morelensis]UFP95983.1 hypothetical protein ISF26_07135 [Gloeobacter morelensis MG652769]